MTTKIIINNLWLDVVLVWTQTVTQIAFGSNTHEWCQYIYFINNNVCVNCHLQYFMHKKSTTLLCGRVFISVVRLDHLICFMHSKWTTRWRVIIHGKSVHVAKSFVKIDNGCLCVCKCMTKSFFFDAKRILFFKRQFLVFCLVIAREIIFCIKDTWKWSFLSHLQSQSSLTKIIFDSLLKVFVLFV